MGECRGIGWFRQGSERWRGTVLLSLLGMLCACAGPDGSSNGTDLDRWREQGRYHLQETRDLDRAIAALESLTARSPSDVDALVALGQALSSAPREWERAANLFESALAADSLDPDAHSGLFDARVRLGDLAAADRVRRRFERLRPDHPFPRVQAVRLAWIERDREAVERSLAELDEAFPDDRTVRAWTAEERARIALVDGRLRAAERLYREALEVAAVRGDPVEIVERAVDLGWALTWWRADTTAAVALVDSVTRAFPMSSMSMDEWPFHYLAEFYALAGLSDKAVDILESHAAHMDPPPDALPNPWWQAAWGLVALDVRRPGEAVERFRSWDEGIGCAICALGDLARALEAAGMHDSATAVWERYLSTPDPQRIEWDPYYLAMARTRLADLYERRGRAQESNALRSDLARQWKGSDTSIPSLLNVLRDPG